MTVNTVASVTETDPKSQDFLPNLAACTVVGLPIIAVTLAADIITFPIQAVLGYYPYGSKHRPRVEGYRQESRPQEIPAPLALPTDAHDH